MQYVNSPAANVFAIVTQAREIALLSAKIGILNGKPGPQTPSR